MAKNAFIAAMVWGYGDRNYGRWRTGRVLTTTADAPARLADVAETLATDGALAAYRLFTGPCRLYGLGPAFGTKYMHFCPQPSAGPDALILDKIVAAWLGQHAGLGLNPLPWSPATYSRAFCTAESVLQDFLDLPPFRDVAGYLLVCTSDAAYES